MLGFRRERKERQEQQLQREESKRRLFRRRRPVPVLQTPASQERVGSRQLIARRHILAAANQHCRRRRKLFGMRSIQQAVFVCRQNKLVKDQVLLDAGFNPHR